MRPQGPQLAGAVDAGGVEQLGRQLQEVLPEDEHRGGVDRERQDHPEVVVAEPVVAGDEHVQRDHQQLERHHQHQEHGGEQHAAAAEVQHGQGVAGEHSEDHRAQQHAAGEDAGVEQRLCQRLIAALICA